jgi:hypothetical protein
VTGSFLCTKAPQAFAALLTFPDANENDLKVNNLEEARETKGLVAVCP